MSRIIYIVSGRADLCARSVRSDALAFLFAESGRRQHQPAEGGHADGSGVDAPRVGDFYSASDIGAEDRSIRFNESAATHHAGEEGLGDHEVVVPRIH